jgi:sortase A
VESIEVIDSEKSSLLINEEEPNLVLITCYPFNALQAGGRLRYVITAKLLPPSYYRKNNSRNK